MSKEDIRKSLESHFYIDKKMISLEQEVARLHCSCYDTKNEEQAILDELNDLRERQKKVRETISLLDDYDLESVLIMRYINHKTEAETADELHYAQRTVQEKIKKAIKILTTKLDEVI